MDEPAASHVLLIEPHRFRFNPETQATNVFQEAVSLEAAQALESLAVEQHRRLRDVLVEHGVTVTLTRSLDATPDGPFCNNWFSTHPPAPAPRDEPAALVVYPLLATNRRPERRLDLIELLRPAYPRFLDFSAAERDGRFLESTGSLVLDHLHRAAYAALSPRTDPGLAAEWARALGYDLIAFQATDRNGIPYYHTNVLGFIGHGLAGIALEAIDDPEQRRVVQERLRQDGNAILPLTRAQVHEYCGNCLALTSTSGEPLWVMSSRAWRAFSTEQLLELERRGRILHVELSAFERLGGGSARCLIAELF